MYKSMIDELKKCREYVNPGSFTFDPTRDKFGIMLLNMGGPDGLDDIQPYLYNLFCDRNIIQLPMSFLLQKPLAKMISARRTPVVRERYKMIGGGSPQLKWTRIEADGMIANLRDAYPGATAYIGMRYTPPFMEEAFEQAIKDDCRHMLLLPLYPHYTLATTGTSLEVAAQWLNRHRPELTISLIPHWHNHPDYIALLRDKIDTAYEKVNDHSASKLLFSAHSLPAKLVAQGDPYEKQINETAKLAGEGYDYLLSYQSQTGPVKWLGPPTPDMIRDLAAKRIKEIVIVPVSFVSDHIETLHEIDVEFKEFADEAGIENFIRTESFNDDPRFEKLLATLVTEHLNGDIR